MESDHDACTETIDLLVTDEERTVLEYAASLEQKSVGAFVAETALRAARALLGETQKSS
jgi:uncharacterized protein (DUF1778 family)